MEHRHHRPCAHHLRTPARRPRGAPGRHPGAADVGVRAHPRRGLPDRRLPAGRLPGPARPRPGHQPARHHGADVLVVEHRRAGGTGHTGTGPRGRGVAVLLRPPRPPRRPARPRRPGPEPHHTVPRRGGLLLRRARGPPALDHRTRRERSRPGPGVDRPAARPQAVPLGAGRRWPALAGLAVRAGQRLPGDPGRPGPHPARTPADARRRPLVLDRGLRAPGGRPRRHPRRGLAGGPRSGPKRPGRARPAEHAGRRARGRRSLGGPGTHRHPVHRLRLGRPGTPPPYPGRRAPLRAVRYSLPGLDPRPRTGPVAGTARPRAHHRGRTAPGTRLLPGRPRLGGRAEGRGRLARPAAPRRPARLRRRPRRGPQELAALGREPAHRLGLAQPRRPRGTRR